MVIISGHLCNAIRNIEPRMSETQIFEIDDVSLAEITVRNQHVTLLSVIMDDSLAEL